ncbi:MAG: hypothetical protein ACR2P0_06370 [Acidimicrobiales bacterium]
MPAAACPPKQPGHLRLVGWNVAGAFQNKAHLLRALEPDIAVVSEACDEARLIRHGVDDFRAASWIGRSPHKGLLVASWGSETKTRTLHTEWDQRLEWVLPVHVKAPLDFSLFGVWSQNLSGEPRRHIRYPSERYRYPCGHLVEAYANVLTKRPAVLLGDFNHHVLWDKGDPTWDFCSLLDMYRSVGLVSAWHAHHGVEVGNPNEPATHWHTYNRAKPYHLDYCFVPEEWVPAMSTVWIGGYDEWGAESPRSDHAPIVVDLNVERLEEQGL